MRLILFVLLVFLIIAGCQEQLPPEMPVNDSVTTPTIECTTNQDCIAIEKCVNNTCVLRADPSVTVPSPECTVDLHCSAAEKCVHFKCVPRGPEPADIPEPTTPEDIPEDIPETTTIPEETTTTTTEDYECYTNADCDDSDASTKDVCSVGNCYNTEIVNCIDNDSYCPPACDYSIDNDCESAYDLDVDISFSKGTYAVGETIDGTYSIVNNGDSFEMYATTYLRKDSGWICGTTSVIDEDASWPAGVVDLTDPQYYSCTGNSFPQSGAYEYKLTVYDCADIESVLGVDCFDANRNDVASSIPARGSTTETITVTG
jgi:hypothetical protein